VSAFACSLGCGRTFSDADGEGLERADRHEAKCDGTPAHILPPPLTQCYVCDVDFQPTTRAKAAKGLCPSHENATAAEKRAALARRDEACS
jgi:hypothetical protein